MYYGTQNFILKLAMGFSTLVTGFLLQWFGSTSEKPLGVQLRGYKSLFITLISSSMVLSLLSSSMIALLTHPLV